MNNGQVGNLLPRPLKTVFKSFSPAWFLCIPLAAVIVVVWNTAAIAQADPPVTLDSLSANGTELKTILDTVFLLLCSILVIFMNAGFGMLEAGFCRQKMR